MKANINIDIPDKTKDKMLTIKKEKNITLALQIQEISLHFTSLSIDECIKKITNQYGKPLISPQVTTITKKDLGDEIKLEKIYDLMKLKFPSLSFKKMVCLIIEDSFNSSHYT